MVVATTALADDAGMHAFWRNEQVRERSVAIAEPGPPETRPLSVRVRPRSIRHEAARHHRGPAPPSRLAAQKQAYAELNPATHPDWYLNDPTLKRGDIVVLSDKVLVYQGARERQRTLADFADLKDATSLTRSTRQILRQAASL